MRERTSVYAKRINCCCSTCSAADSNGRTHHHRRRRRRGKPSLDTLVRVTCRPTITGGMTPFPPAQKRYEIRATRRATVDRNIDVTPPYRDIVCPSTLPKAISNRIRTIGVISLAEANRRRGRSSRENPWPSPIITQFASPPSAPRTGYSKNENPVDDTAAMTQHRSRKTHSEKVSIPNASIQEASVYHIHSLIPKRIQQT